MKQIKRYKGVSLVEMLISMVVISVVLIVTTVTLTTLIRASAISASKTAARTESDFILELMRRNIKNSQPEDISLFIPTGRVFDETTGKVISTGSVGGYGSAIGEGVPGVTEIHFRPLGQTNWVCFGFFPGRTDSSRGYLLKSFRTSMVTHDLCFDSTQPEYSLNTIVLNSSEIDVNSLSMSYYIAADSNAVVSVDLEVEPIRWVASTNMVSPTYFKQMVAVTQKLTWEN